MKSSFELSYETLSYDEGQDILKFKSTEDIDGSDRLIGQERAEKAMEFGVRIKKKGYNIYVSGDNETGKVDYVIKFLQNISKSDETPDDWCYIYNFENEYEPIALRFLPGMGKIFKQDIEYLISEVIDKIPDAFNSKEYDRQKSEILDDYNNRKNNLIDQLNVTAEAHNILVKGTPNGLAFTPIVDKKPLSEYEFNNLDKEQKEQILSNVSKIKEEAVDVLKKISSLEQEADDKINKLDKEISTFVLDSLFSKFKQKYEDDNKVLNYLDSMKEDILQNISIFIDGINKNSMSNEIKEFLQKYKVNLIVDNGDSQGAPVIYEQNATYTNLIGSVEYENKHGTLITNFLKIRAGSIIKANGGYLILNVDNLLKNLQAWEALKRVLKSGEVRIEGIRNQLELLTIETLKPKAISVSLKIVLIGSEYIYQILNEIDDEFPELFKVKAAFESEVDRNDDSIFKTVQFISEYCSKNNVRHLDKSGVWTILQYSSKITGNRNKLSACLQNIMDIVEEANVWADMSRNRYISKAHIDKAIAERRKRDGLVEEKILELYRDKKIMINVNGKEIGQINGLSVIDTGCSIIGKPCRITASVYMGKGGIINIERETQMSGSIHSKGVMILAGYIGEKYARTLPLSITANICFEQIYGTIDGDSASIAELYAILSSITGIPLRQGIAVTGSLNQKGEVQPVGGINEKIEGFYKVCKLYGLDKNQGVIIPYWNINNVMLDDDIMKDIRYGNFHIYAIKNVEEGIEILTGLRPGAIQENGEYPQNTFNYFVDAKLKEFIRNYNNVSEMKN